MSPPRLKRSVAKRQLPQPSREEEQSDMSATELLVRRIRDVATDLFVRRGYNGVSYLDIARHLDITHSNIHYYYKTKSILAEACLAEYANATLTFYDAIWTNPASELLQKFVETRDWAYLRYLRYNPSGKGASHWGLLDRFASDSDALSSELKRMIRETARRLDTCIDRGVQIAIDTELRHDTPRADLVLQISTVLYSSRQVTRYRGSFERLDDLMRSTFDTIYLAYGRPPSNRRSWPVMAPPDKDSVKDLLRLKRS